jgi:glycosyltransferase involved in cell wall biosynthesis
MGEGSGGAVAVIIPAKDEAQRVAATARAAAGISGVDLVVVVDDGSRDDTATVAQQAGALVVRHAVNRGKAAAMQTGAEAVRAVDQRERRAAPRHLLFLDADLEQTAASAAPIVGPVLSDEADMTIAVLPPQYRPGGGHGFVVRLSRNGIRRATGWTPTQPLSGQRCITRAAFDAALPLAGGFGVETALTIDLLRQGFRVQEVEAELHHRVTGKDWRAQLHRLRQYRDVARALVRRRILPIRG